MGVQSRFSHDPGRVQRLGGEIEQGEQTGPKRAVEDFPALASIGNQPGLAQGHQVLRNVGLPITELGFHLAHADLTPAQQVQDLQPGGVGDQAKQVGQALDVGHGNHIQDPE
jgi:hypothetical protein